MVDVGAQGAWLAPSRVLSGANVDQVFAGRRAKVARHDALPPNRSYAGHPKRVTVSAGWWYDVEGSFSVRLGARRWLGRACGLNEFRWVPADDGSDGGGEREPVGPRR